MQKLEFKLWTDDSPVREEEQGFAGVFSKEQGRSNPQCSSLRRRQQGGWGDWRCRSVTEGEHLLTDDRKERCSCWRDCQLREKERDNGDFREPNSKTANEDDDLAGRERVKPTDAEPESTEKEVICATEEVIWWWFTEEKEKRTSKRR